MFLADIYITVSLMDLLTWTQVVLYQYFENYSLTAKAKDIGKNQARERFDNRQESSTFDSYDLSGDISADLYIQAFNDAYGYPIEESDKKVLLETSDITGSPQEGMIDQLMNDLKSDSEDQYIEEKRDDVVDTNNLETIHVDIPKEVEKMKTHLVEDGCIGKQVWAGRIVGRTMKYIHFAGRKRIWLDVRKHIHEIRLGDLVLIEVERKNNGDVVVNNITRVSVTKNQVKGNQKVG